MPDRGVPRGPPPDRRRPVFPQPLALHEKLGRPLADAWRRADVWRPAGPSGGSLHRACPSGPHRRSPELVGDGSRRLLPAHRQVAHQAPTPRSPNATPGSACSSASSVRPCAACPASGAVLFGIRVHVWPLATAIVTPEVAAALASAIRAPSARDLAFQKPANHPVRPVGVARPPRGVNGPGPPWPKWIGSWSKPSAFLLMQSAFLSAVKFLSGTQSPAFGPTKAVPRPRPGDARGCDNPTRTASG